MERHEKISSTRVGDTIREAAHRIDESSERFASKSDELINRGEEYSEAVMRYIKKNPVKSTLIAGTVGFILGKIFRF